MVSTNPFEKKMFLKLDHFPKDRGKKKQKILKPPPSYLYILDAPFSFDDKQIQAFHFTVNIPNDPFLHNWNR